MPKTYTLITGASNGIGKATAILCGKNKRNLILLARRKDRLDKLKFEIEQEYGVSVRTYQVDLENMDEIDQFFTDINEYEINVLVNNAGLAAGKEKFADYNWQDFQQMIDVNITAFTRVAKLTIPKLIKTNGHLVNISSIAGSEAYEGGSVYCATKSYVKMISKALRIDLMGTNVRVTDISPGTAETEFALVRFKGDQETAKDVYKGFIPLKADDIAEAILFALSRPAHVNIDSISIMATAQASATHFFKGK